MQGFEMLLYGTGDTLYDDEPKKWVVGSQGFTDSLNFIKTVYTRGPRPDAAAGARPDLEQHVGQRAAARGQARRSPSTAPGCRSNWLPSGAKPWPQWSRDDRQTAHADPERRGQRQGQPVRRLDLGDPDEVQERRRRLEPHQARLQTRRTRSSTPSSTRRSPVRKDVAADPAYVEGNPTNEVLHRPGLRHPLPARPTRSTRRSPTRSRPRRRR